MGNLVFTANDEQPQQEPLSEPVNNNQNYSSITPDTKPANPNEMFERSVEPQTTQIEQTTTTSSIETSTNTPVSDGNERCRGCNRNDVPLYTRGMMQLRVCSDCID